MKEKRSNRIIWIISLLLIFLGAAGLAAALLMPGGGTFQEEETEEVITFAVYGDTEMQRIGDQVAETFMNQNHCKVEIYCYPTEEEEREQVLGQLPAAGVSTFSMPIRSCWKRCWRTGSF